MREGGRRGFDWCREIAARVNCSSGDYVEDQDVPIALDRISDYRLQLSYLLSLAATMFAFAHALARTRGSATILTQQESRLRKSHF